jgi:Transposase DDE domain
LSLDEALILARARWQIELLFKLWKQQGQIDEWRSQKPWAILCEVYAKLIAMVFQHWLLLLGCWQLPDRSLVKASQAVRTFAPLLTSALPWLGFPLCRFGAPSGHLAGLSLTHQPAQDTSQYLSTVAGT